MRSKCKHTFQFKICLNSQLISFNLIPNLQSRFITDISNMYERTLGGRPIRWKRLPTAGNRSDVYFFVLDLALSIAL